jgi:formamidopyrimidine-DNA glycosylase
VPELPETETIARDLDREIRGRRITGVAVTRPDVLREVSADEFAARLTGATVLSSWRRAKLVVLELDSGDRIVVQARSFFRTVLSPGRKLRTPHFTWRSTTGAISTTVTYAGSARWRSCHRSASRAIPAGLASSPLTPRSRRSIYREFFGVLDRQ